MVMTYNEKTLSLFLWLQIKWGFEISFSGILFKDMGYGHSIEAPRRCASNGYPQHMFSWRNKENTSTFRLKKCALSSVVDIVCFNFQALRNKL